MKLTLTFLTLGILSFTIFISAALATHGFHIRDADVARRQAIKDEFTRNWNGYVKYASDFDKLSPRRRGGYDDDVLAGFKGTVVESLGSMIVMGMGDSAEYKRMLEIVKKVDFTSTKQGNPVGVVSVFELTIRYIGGLLSAYQLNGEKKEDFFLVEQAKTLADGLIVAWHGDFKIPLNSVNINLKKPNDITNNANLAEAGTLTMEWGMLSKYTNDPKYAKLTQGSVDAIISTPGYFPSVWPSHIWPSTLKPASTYISTGGATDSFIEYLLKFPVLVDQMDHRYAQTYGKMIDTFQEKLVSKTNGNLTFIADYNIGNKQIAYVGSHLACFIGGNIAYAGRLYRRDDWTQLGLEVTESCYQTYKAMATGIGPYSIGWYDANGEAKGWEDVPNGQREFSNDHGFFMQVSSWLHHPEVIESIFYGHRITGDPKWREMAWEAFQAIKKYADARGIAIAGIQNVNDLNTPQYDQTETYFFSETLKYLYLIFSEADDYSLDEYVFTTEGHLFKRGSGAILPSKSKRAAGGGATSSTISSKWGKVQQHPFNYKYLFNKIPLSSSNALGSMKLSVGSLTTTKKVDDQAQQEKKQGVFFAPPSADKETMVKSTMSLLNVEKDVAYAMLSRCPSDQSKLVQPNGNVAK